MKRVVLGLVAAMGIGGVATATNAAVILSETYVESRTGGKNFGDYVEHGGGFPDSWANSTAKSTAPGTTAGIGSRFNSNAGFGGWFEVSPTLPTAGGTYEVYATVTHASGNITTTTAVAVTGGTGLPAQTGAFSVDSVTQPGNAWNLIGTLVLDAGVNSPTIRFSEVTHTNRLYADAIRFAEVAVPEPTALAALGLAGATLLGGRRRRA